MLIDKTLARLERAQGQDDRELKRAARDLGRELARGDPEMLAHFISACSRLPEAYDLYVKGFRATLMELASAFMASIQDKQEEVAIVERAQQEGWQHTLEMLDIEPQPRSEINAELLGQLAEAQVVDLFKGVSHVALTLRGERVLAALRAAAQPSL